MYPNVDLRGGDANRLTNDTNPGKLPATRQKLDLAHDHLVGLNHAFDLDQTAEAQLRKRDEVAGLVFDLRSSRHEELKAQHRHGSTRGVDLLYRSSKLEVELPIDDLDLAGQDSRIGQRPLDLETIAHLKIRNCDRISLPILDLGRDGDTDVDRVGRSHFHDQ